MDWLSHLADAPFANVLFLAGLGFLAVGVLGKIAGKIEPDRIGRVASAVVGVVLVCLGLYLHVTGDHEKTQRNQANNVSGAPPNTTPVTLQPVKTPNNERPRTHRNNVSHDPFVPSRGIGDRPSVPVPPPPVRPPRSPDLCKAGFVWREAVPHDHVCVTPATRELTAEQNREAAIHRNPAGGPYGVDTCLQGFVWREALPTDHVCVTPEVRRQAAVDNAEAQFRRAPPN